MPTLLPVFEQFKLTQDLSAEEPETFAWLHDDERADFEKARAGLDSIPGSREYLKNYTFQKEDEEAIDGLADMLAPMTIAPVPVIEELRLVVYRKPKVSRKKLNLKNKCQKTNKK